MRKIAIGTAAMAAALVIAAVVAWPRASSQADRLVDACNAAASALAKNQFEISGISRSARRVELSVRSNGEASTLECRFRDETSGVPELVGLSSDGVSLDSELVSANEAIWTAMR